MKIVALIACTKKKRQGTFEAKYLYDESPLFRKSYQYAKQITDKIYILSAKYGLLKDTDVISTYDETLRNKKKSIKMAWGNKVKQQLKDNFDLANTKFLILAGNDYFEPIENIFIIKPENPLQGLKQGPRQRWLKEHLNQ